MNDIEITMQQHVNNLLARYDYVEHSRLPDLPELPPIIMANCMLEIVRQLREMNELLGVFAEEVNRD